MVSNQRKNSSIARLKNVLLLCDKNSSHIFNSVINHSTKCRIVPNFDAEIPVNIGHVLAPHFENRCVVSIQ